MRDIISGTLGGVVFGVLYLALSIPLPFAVGGAVVGYVAGRLIAGRSSVGPEGPNAPADAELVGKMIAEGEAQVGVLAKLAEEIKKPEIREKCRGLAAAAAKIVAEIKEKPKDAKRVRQFLNYYLGATCTIVQRYAELSARDIQSADVSASLAKVESMLDAIQHVFEQQMVAASQDDILDLDTEIRVLEQTLQLENLNGAK